MKIKIGGVENRVTETYLGRCKAKTDMGANVTLSVNMSIGVVCRITLCVTNKYKLIMAQSEHSATVHSMEDVKNLAKTATGVDMEGVDCPLEIIIRILCEVATDDFVIVDNVQDKFAVTQKETPKVIELC